MGANKKESQQNAAAQALKLINSNPDFVTEIIEKASPQSE